MDQKLIKQIEMLEKRINSSSDLETDLDDENDMANDSLFDDYDDLEDLNG